MMQNKIPSSTIQLTKVRKLGVDFCPSDRHQLTYSPPILNAKAKTGLVLPILLLSYIWKTETLIQWMFHNPKSQISNPKWHYPCGLRLAKRRSRTPMGLKRFSASC
jgi:hypothetical protein